MRVAEDNTDLGGSCALLCELTDLVDNLLRSGLEPGWGSSRVWDCGGRYAFAVAVESTHLDGG